MLLLPYFSVSWCTCVASHRYLKLYDHLKRKDTEPGWLAEAVHLLYRDKPFPGYMVRRSRSLTLPRKQEGEDEEAEAEAQIRRFGGDNPWIETARKDPGDE